MSESATLCEFYIADTARLLTRTESGGVPAVGERINIRKQWYVVVGRKWAVDHSDGRYRDRRLRVNFDLLEEDDSVHV